MQEETSRPTFLGLDESAEGEVDIAILQVPYELTSSYGQGSVDGPAATVLASAQVELFDPILSQDLPCGRTIRTVQPWDGEGDSLEEQLQGVEEHLAPWVQGTSFPLVLGGEHGILPAVMRALRDHPTLEGDLSRLTLVQVDAHADLRDELDGDPHSHACAARRSLDEGVGRLLQIGIRAFSREEATMMAEDDRIDTWLARDVLSLCDGEAHWRRWKDVLASLSGPVWLTIDVDGLDPAYVPTTGTPVPGGLAYWQVAETIEAVAAASDAELIGADINEIVPDENNRITEFTAAMLATKVVAAHIASRQAGGP